MNNEYKDTKYEDNNNNNESENNNNNNKDNNDNAKNKIKYKIIVRDFELINSINKFKCII